MYSGLGRALPPTTGPWLPGTVYWPYGPEPWIDVMAGLGQDDDLVNPCGGMRWQTLSDGRIQLEDGSIPEFAPDSPTFENLRLTWENWAPEFRAAARAKGVKVPVGWLVAIANNETGFLAKSPETQARVLSGDGFGSIGIMQPLAMNARELGYDPDDRYDPYLNIEMGAKELTRGFERPNGQKGGFPVVAAMFNGGPGNGGCKMGNDIFNLKGYKGKYATMAIKGLNSAIAYLPLEEKSGLRTAAMGVGLMGVGLAVAVALWPRKRSA